jgi:predicted GTPase
MKALTDKIIENIKNTSEGCFNDLEKRSLNNVIEMIKRTEKEATFEEVARVMMKHLGDGQKYHPHHTVIITNATAELTEGVKALGQVMDYVPD